MLDEHARRSLRGRADRETVARRHVQVNARREHTVDVAERSLELTCETGDELRVLRGLARHELTTIDRIEEAVRSRPWQLLVCHGRQRTSRIVARDEDAKAPFGGGVGLLRGVDALLIERDDDAIRVALFETGSHRNRAAGKYQQQEREHDGSGEAAHFSRHCI